MKKPKKKPTIKPPLSDAEVEAVIVARITGGAGNPVTQAEIEAAVEWAECARLDAELLGCVLKGDFVLGGVGPNGSMRFSLSEKGLKRADAMFGGAAR